MSVTRQAVERGDVVTVSGRHVGESPRLGEILDVLGDADHPHYLVRWEDGHESLLYPGETTTVARRRTATGGTPQLDLAVATRLLIDTVRDAGLECEVLPHRRTTTAAAEARVLGVLPQAVAKTIVARAPDDRLVRAVVPAAGRVETAKLAKAVSAASVVLLSEAELITAYPEFELGAVAPFGGPAGDRIVVDRELAMREHVVFDAGVHDAALRMRSEDLIAISGAHVADITVD